MTKGLRTGGAGMFGPDPRGPLHQAVRFAIAARKAALIRVSCG